MPIGQYLLASESSQKCILEFFFWYSNILISDDQILTWISEAALRENSDTTRKASVFFLLLKVRCVMNIALTRAQNAMHEWLCQFCCDIGVNSWKINKCISLFQCSK